jgi:GNAT superfamily N-acetyltransferase
MPDISLRPALESDAKTISDLIHRAGITPLGLDWRRFVIAETPEKRFMGCAQLKPHGDGSCELASLAVEQEFRNQGVARTIIAHFLGQGSHPLYLMCRPSLVPFDGKCGFRVIGPEGMPPYFRRIRRLTRTLVFLAKHRAPAIMRLD